MAIVREEFQGEVGDRVALPEAEASTNCHIEAHVVLVHGFEAAKILEAEIFILGCGNWLSVVNLMRSSFFLFFINKYIIDLCNVKPGLEPAPDRIFHEQQD